MIKELIFFMFVIGIVFADANVDFKAIAINYNYEGNPPLPYLDLIMKGAIFLAIEIIAFGQVFGKYLIPFHSIIGIIILLLVFGGKNIAYGFLIPYLVIKNRHSFLKRKEVEK